MYYSNPFRQIDNYGATGALNASTLTLPQMLTYALQDEYLAQARYNNILETFGYIRPFAQIRNAELRHINALLPLFYRYQIPLPKDISYTFITTPENIKAAYATKYFTSLKHYVTFEDPIATEELLPIARPKL